MKLSNTEQLLVTCTLHVENNRLETDAHSLRRGVGLTFCQEVGQWSSSGIVPVLIWYDVSTITDVQLQLWVLH
jgi:hypothetical protein